MSEIKFPGDQPSLTRFGKSLADDYILLAATCDLVLATPTFPLFGDTSMTFSVWISPRVQDESDDRFSEHLFRFVTELCAHLKRFQVRGLNSDLGLNFSIYMGTHIRHPSEHCIQMKHIEEVDSAELARLVRASDLRSDNPADRSSCFLTWVIKKT